MYKAVILIGGPQKGELFKQMFFIMTTDNYILIGTRFRPLSLDVPKPLFPVAGRPIIQHHIEACVQIPKIKEILIIGYYPATQMEQFVCDMQHLYDGISIRCGKCQ